MSRQTNFDELLITVKDNNAFASETMAVMPEDWRMKKKIPTQGFGPEIEAIE